MALKLFIRKTWLLALVNLLGCSLVMGTAGKSQSDSDSDSDELYGAQVPTQTVTPQDESSEELPYKDSDARNRIKKIKFHLIKTPKDRVWQDDRYEKLNKALKKIYIKAPNGCQDFLNGQVKIEVYNLLKRILHHPDDVSSDPKVWPEPIMKALDQALIGFCQKNWQKIKKNKINRVLNECLGSHYHMMYLQKSLGPPGFNARVDDAQAFKYMYQSCDDSDDTDVPFSARKLCTEFYGGDDNDIDDTGTVIVLNESDEDDDEDDSPSSHAPAVVILLLGGAGGAKLMHHHRQKTKIDQLQEGTTKDEDQEGAQV